MAELPELPPPGVYRIRYSYPIPPHPAIEQDFATKDGSKVIISPLIPGPTPPDIENKLWELKYADKTGYNYFVSPYGAPPKNEPPIKNPGWSYKEAKDGEAILIATRKLFSISLFPLPNNPRYLIRIPNPDPSSLIIYYVGVKSFPDLVVEGLIGSYENAPGWMFTQVFPDAEMHQTF